MTVDGIIEGGSASSFRGNVTGGMDKSFSRFSKSMQSYDKKDVLMPLGVIFSAIIFGSAVGAASYRRKAKELAKKYPHRFEPPPAVKSGSVVEPPIQYGQVRARDVLTGREIFKLFALPGAISIVILGVTMKVVSVTTGVGSFKEAQHLVRWANEAAKPKSQDQL